MSKNQGLVLTDVSVSAYRNVPVIVRTVGELLEHRGDPAAEGLLVDLVQRPFSPDLLALADFQFAAASHALKEKFAGRNMEAAGMLFAQALSQTVTKIEPRNSAEENKKSAYFRWCSEALGQPLPIAQTPQNSFRYFLSTALSSFISAGKSFMPRP